MWPMTTILDSVVRKHFHSCRKFHGTVLLLVVNAEPLLCLLTPQFPGDFLYDPKYETQNCKDNLNAVKPSETIPEALSFRCKQEDCI